MKNSIMDKGVRVMQTELGAILSKIGWRVKISMIGWWFSDVIGGNRIRRKRGR